MPEIHPTVIVDGDVELAGDVLLGPHCVLHGPIRIGPGTRLIGHVYVQGPLEMGRENLVYPFTTLGFCAQHVKADPRSPGPGTRIGDGNVIREQVSIHRAFLDERPTTIGDRNYFMADSHVGHDSVVGHGNTLVNGAQLGGHVVMGDRVVVGGNTGIHQHCRVGTGAMLSGGVGASSDVPPWFMVTAINYAPGPNLVGLRRAGYGSQDVDDVRFAYRVICREGLGRTRMLERLSERAGRPLIDQYVAFVETASRAMVSARARRARQSGDAGAGGPVEGDDPA